MSRITNVNISKSFVCTIIYSCVLTMLLIYNISQPTIKKQFGKINIRSVTKMRKVIDQTKVQTIEAEVDVYPGYISLATKERLRLSCTECAVVASSGHLTGSNAGQEIDEFNCVIRMNLAPVTGFEHDVGKRTTTRVIGHRNFNKGLGRTKIRDEVLVNKTTRANRIIISWMSMTHRVEKFTNAEYQFAFFLANHYPDVPIYSSQPDRMKLAEELFHQETGFTRQQAHTMLTTGWYTMVHAMEVCPTITVYGMAHDELCSTTNVSVSYHYYDHKKSECKYYNSSENNQHRGHLFITEKAIFRRWANYMDIKFKHPDWPEKAEDDGGRLHTPFFDKFVTNRNTQSKHHFKVKRKRSGVKLTPKKTVLLQRNLLNKDNEEEIIGFEDRHSPGDNHINVKEKSGKSKKKVTKLKRKKARVKKT